MNITLDLPSDGEILVKAGSEIDFETPIVKHHATEEVKIPLSKLLKIPETKIFNYLIKFAGETIHKGDLIAENKSMFLKKQYFSEYDGVIKEINHSEGAIIMQISSNEKTTDISIVKGEVVSVAKKQLEVKLKNAKSFTIRDVETSFGGEALYCKPGRAQLLTETEVNGMIIVTKALLPYEHIKLETLGAKGFVLGEQLSDKTFLPVVILEHAEDMDKIFEYKLSCCTIDKNNTTIYFYS